MIWTEVEAIKDFAKALEQRFGKSCSEQCPWTYIELTSDKLWELVDEFINN